MGDDISMSSRGRDGSVSIPQTVLESGLNSKPGIFVVVDGLDGIGKGEIERALRGYEEKQGKAIFDAISWSKAYESLPELKDFYGVPTPHFNTIMTAEPTYVGGGRDIRGEIIVKGTSRSYPVSVQIQAYSIDRFVQMQKVVVPALEQGLTCLQSRCLASTLCYQFVVGQSGGLDESTVWSMVLDHPGNQYQLDHRPDLLILPTIKDISSLQARLIERGKNEKDDRAMFENAVFQGKLKPLYESSKLRELFESRGSKVAYLNAGLSPEDTRNQAVEVYKTFIDSGEVLEHYRSPESVLGIATQ